MDISTHGVEHLREQLRFMEASAAAYDDGFEGEAKRLATVIRVLAHDSRRSRSVLRLLGVKDQPRYVDAREAVVCRSRDRGG